MTAVIAAPADRPVTNTRAGSRPYAATACATICRIDSASPDPRAVSPGSNQLKHRLALFAVRCSANTSAKPHRSA